LEEEEEDGSRIKSGMTKRTPRWVVPFLRALERTGEVRTAAIDAGIDHSTAYARRRARREFAEAWTAALVAHGARVEEERAEELALTPPPASLVPLPTGIAGREELIAGRSQLKRAGHDRWSRRKEKLFFDELAATANVKQAAKAAGVSANAVYQRRIRDPHFKAKWAAVLESGRASIEMHLVEAANRSFEPEELDTGDVPPKVSVAEAIRIVQVHGSKKQQEELPDPYAEQAASMTETEVDELRARIVRKLQAMRRRDRPALLAQGWSYDQEHDRDIPPGWVRAAE